MLDATSYHQKALLNNIKVIPIIYVAIDNIFVHAAYNDPAN